MNFAFLTTVLIELSERFRQPPLGLVIAVHQANLLGPPGHAGDEVEQPVAVGVGGIAADGVDTGLYLEDLAVQFHLATLPLRLQFTAGGAGGLVADEQDIVARVAEHRLEVIDDAAAGAHA